MRCVLLILVVVLVVSGFCLAWTPPEKGFSLPLIVHLWAGLFFMAVFPLYAWEHIKQRQAFLKHFAIASSGILQCIAGGVLIITGILLFLYESNQLKLIQKLHFHWTWGLLVIFTCHFITVRRRNKK